MSASAAVADGVVAMGSLPNLADVYRQHFDYVWHALRRLGVHSANLEDVAQEVFVVVQRKLNTFDVSRPMKPWLFGILHRVAADHRRLAYHQREVGELPAGHAAPETHSPERVAQASQDRDLVLRALDALDEDKRAVMVMHELHEHPVPEVAEALGIPLNTAYSRLRLARAEFATEVKRLRGDGGAR